MIYLVSYTLSPGRAAPNIEDELKRSPGWWHHLDFTWIIATKESIDELYKRLAIRFLDTDHFLIIEIPPNSRNHGWLPSKAWKWLKDNKNY